MLGLDPSIHARRVGADKKPFRAIALSWMAGSRPAMTSLCGPLAGTAFHGHGPVNAKIGTFIRHIA